MGDSKVVIIGGGATGCEVAHHLVEKGCRVTIIEQLPKIAINLESITRKVLISRLKDMKVEFALEHTLDGPIFINHLMMNTRSGKVTGNLNGMRSMGGRLADHVAQTTE